MKPMKASPVDFKKLEYPCFASAKLDGIRAVIDNGIVKSNSMKPLPNNYLQFKLGDPILNGLDGELTVGPPNAKDVMQKTSSGIMSIQGQPDFVFNVFDFFTDLNAPYAQRFDMMRGAFRSSVFPPWIKLLPQTIIRNRAELDAFEASMLAEGYEGVMLRSLSGVYKFGRSTTNEGYLLKLKQFVDSEAIVIGAKELMHNDNEQTRNELGLAKRSSAKEGLVPAGVLGAFVVRDLISNVEFDVGTGFTADQRKDFWNRYLKGGKDSVLGEVITYKHFEVSGVKDAPRFPVFKCFRYWADR